MDQAALRAVHYLNQFFGGIGGEERADAPGGASRPPLVRAAGSSSTGGGRVPARGPISLDWRLEMYATAGQVGQSRYARED